MILELHDGKKWAIEVKSDLGPKVTKGFHHSLEDIDPDQSFVVYAGSERYPITEKSDAVSLTELALELSALEKTIN